MECQISGDLNKKQQEKNPTNLYLDVKEKGHDLENSQQNRKKKITKKQKVSKPTICSLSTSYWL